MFWNRFGSMERLESVFSLVECEDFDDLFFDEMIKLIINELFV